MAAPDQKRYCTLLDKWNLLSLIFSDTELGESDKMVAFRLLCHFNQFSGLCFPSYNTLAEGSGIERRTAMRAVNRLVERGWFSRMTGGGRGRSNSYWPAFKRLETVSCATPFSGDENPEKVSQGAKKGVTARPKTVSRESPQYCKENVKQSDANEVGGSRGFDEKKRCYPARKQATAVRLMSKLVLDEFSVEGLAKWIEHNDALLAEREALADFMRTPEAQWHECGQRLLATVGKAIGRRE